MKEKYADALRSSARTDFPVALCRPREKMRQNGTNFDFHKIEPLRHSHLRRLPVLLSHFQRFQAVWPLRNLSGAWVLVPGVFIGVYSRPLVPGSRFQNSMQLHANTVESAPVLDHVDTRSPAQVEKAVYEVYTRLFPGGDRLI